MQKNSLKNIIAKTAFSIFLMLLPATVSSASEETTLQLQQNDQMSQDTQETNILLQDSTIDPSRDDAIEEDMQDQNTNNSE